MEFENSLILGDAAPEFCAKSTAGDICLSDYKGKWLVFFSHPGDFTPVCTTEFIEFARMANEFKKINCELLGLSIDSNPSHLAWLNNIKLKTNIHIPFPIIADRDGNVATKYHMINQGNINNGTVRSVYIICPEGKIRAIFTYPKEVGRNISEILRTVTALQYSDKHSVMTPANWVPGMPYVIPPPSTFNGIDNNLSTNDCLDWYLCFKGGNLNE